MAVFAVGLCTTSGCEDEEATKAASAAHTFTNETVTIAVPKGMGFSEGWKGLLDEWGEQTGAAYRLVEYEEGNGGQKGLADRRLDRFPFRRYGRIRGGRPAGPDAARPDLGGLGHGVARLLFGPARSGCSPIGGAPTIIPFSCPVLTCYYAAGLVGARRAQKPPRTWDEYQALVESLAELGAGPLGRRAVGAGLSRDDVSGSCAGRR